MIKYFTKIALLILSTLLINGLFAENASVEVDNDPESNWEIGISLGYGERRNPLINADDIKLAIDLDIAWYGQKWFFDNGDLGFTLKDNQTSTLNTVARINSDRVFFQKTNTQYISIGGLITDTAEFTIAPPLGLEDQFAAFEIPDRDYALELGFEYLKDGDWGNLHSDIYQDISGTHQGTQASVSYAYPYQVRRWYIEPSIGVSWKSKKINTYYWGLSEEETQSLLLPYTARAGINSQARVLFSYQMNKNWSWVSAFDYEKLSSEIADSPIVEKNNVFAWYSGFRYKF